ncbi:MAG: UDP-N-acetylmuramoyl-L-alanyl-D-glutamate--2,6-diaminopimelate ligase, partial [Clostridia bacterium]|nr:UDP-N-acetylmuramoyl-L-alanyl-D-glutamate--2,6-diaminopimelate ligase [Clostridia bacterium]
MKLQDLLRETDISLPDGWGERDITAITCDSRRVEDGCLFVCIDGTAVDAHRFAPQAQRDGAAAIVVQRDMGLSCQLMTAHTRQAWAQICANWFGRPATRLRMIGITGTNGKTTTSTLIKSMLEYGGHKVGLIGTIQNMIGDTVLPSGHTTPDSYDLQRLLAQMADEGCDYCVMEVSSHALHQHRVDGCTYEVGVFTNLTQDHLDYHGTMEEYLAAKKRLFAISRAAILNRDDSWYDKTVAGIPCPVTTYGVDGGADVAADEIAFRGDGVDFRLTMGGESRRIAMQIPGRFSVYNGLAAASVCLTLGMDLDAVAAALSAAQGVKGRAEVVPNDRDFTVVIDCAHTPDGL